MLTNYDARAVAEVMGIAFLRRAGAHPADAAADGREATNTLAEVFSGRFVLSDDESLVLVVEAKAGNTFARFDQPAKRRAAVGDEVISAPSPALIEKAVERGLPRQALRHVAAWLAGGDKAKASSLEWALVPKTTLERRQTQLSPQESERTERVARLFVHARRALGTEPEAREFMTAAHPLLDGRSPVDAARTDLGARRVEQVLNGLEYGLAL